MVIFFDLSVEFFFRKKYSSEVGGISAIYSYITINFHFGRFAFEVGIYDLFFAFVEKCSRSLLAKYSILDFQCKNVSGLVKIWVILGRLFTAF